MSTTGLTAPSPSESTLSSNGSHSHPVVLACVVIANVLIILIIYFVFLFWKCNKGSVWDETLDNSGNSTDSSPCSSPRASRIKKSDLSFLPEFVHGEIMTSGDEKDECAVCITDFVAGQKGRALPACGHKFHTDCIDTWFRKHFSCPVCRTDVRAKKHKEEDGKICLEV